MGTIGVKVSEICFIKILLRKVKLYFRRSMSWGGNNRDKKRIYSDLACSILICLHLVTTGFKRLKVSYNQTGSASAFMKC